jgi:S-methylmethionine-dependent homocysteine/selenocysteine methylase
VGCWLRWMRAGTFVAGCCCRTSLAESVAYALSGSARPHCD